MYPGKYATTHPDRAAFIMASTGEAVSYAEFEGRSNRLAQLLRAQGLVHEDHYSVFMENNNRYLEAVPQANEPGCTTPASTHSLPLKKSPTSFKIQSRKYSSPVLPSKRLRWPRLQVVRN